MHSNPRNRGCYVPDEPPGGGKFFNHVGYCLREGIARVGWPDTGDLRHVPQKVGARCDCYRFDSRRVEPHQRAYLLAFRAIARGSVVLLPDRSHPAHCSSAT